MPKKGLGKGLSALIPSLQASDKSQVIEVPVEDLRPNPFQPRVELEEEAIEKLAESIKVHGVIQPIVVREKDGGYEIVAGERRFRAAISAGLKKIPAIVRNLNDADCALVALVENLQRENLNPLEEALAYKNLQERFGLKQEEIAERLGISRSAVANTIRLLSLPEEVKEMLAKNKISRGHAVAISGLPTSEMQVEAAKTVLRNALSVRETEKLVNLLKANKGGKKEIRSSVKGFKEMERELTSKLGMKTRIKMKKSGIEIVVKATSFDELNEFMKKLGG